MNEQQKRSLLGLRITAQQALDDLEKGDYERATYHATLIRDALGAFFSAEEDYSFSDLYAKYLERVGHD